MPDINPEQLNEWIDVFWSIGSKGLLVFVVVYYRELVIEIGKTILSWLKRK